MNAIVKSAGTAANKIGFQLKKHSPEILVVGGVIGMVGAAVMACKATPKAIKVLEESKDKIEKINEAKTLVEKGDVSEEDYSKEDHTKDLIGEYIRMGFGLAKTYAPAVIVGGLSIAAIFGGHKILRGRNLALAAAYATIDKSFKQYRGNVVDRFGAEVDRQLKYNLKAEEITEKIEDPETGKTKKVKKTVYKRIGDETENGYSRLFSAGCENWNNNPTLNQSFLSSAQSFYQKKLETFGYVFLSDVYKYLGFRETPASRVVGWIYDKNNEIGDNQIDFGFMNDPNFMGGYETDVWLDFNVDGPILDRFEAADATLAVC